VTDQALGHRVELAAAREVGEVAAAVVRQVVQPLCPQSAQRRDLRSEVRLQVRPAEQHPTGCHHDELFEPLEVSHEVDGVDRADHPACGQHDASVGELVVGEGPRPYGRGAPVPCSGQHPPGGVVVLVDHGLDRVAPRGRGELEEVDQRVCRMVVGGHVGCGGGHGSIVTDEVAPAERGDGILAAD
jgi:hypothetical protein